MGGSLGPSPLLVEGICLRFRESEQASPKRAAENLLE